MTGLKIAIVVGEESGDQLGFKLMHALKASAGTDVAFSGVGGRRMTEEGMESLFPLHDVAVMGVTAVIGRLPTIIRRVHGAVDAIVREDPDILVIIDSPDFTHAVAKRVRRRLPDLPIVDYVSPSVWAWRSGRARKMRAYVDHILALLPFEPEVHRKLGGPPCTYVGHPLTERLDALTPNQAELAERNASDGPLLVLPGSRRSVAERMLPVFRATIQRIAGTREIIMPTVPALQDWLRDEVAGWDQPVRLVLGDDEKFAEFRRARAALVCSGTSSLELALAGVPMIVGYRVPPFESLFVPLVRVPSIVLPNLILGENAIPEFLHGPCRPEILAPALTQIIAETPKRQHQVEAFKTLRLKMETGDETPSQRSARIVLEVLHEKTGR
ncbi:lipid-A-disaccharide synthase [Agaricicola taiwanensis]|uniref:Lipid-A-disaccharide synthase n=1 Tax=Agaricicola taiwanensis TaxID=591372 RepID=A0A8J2YIG9_9RHOB|nr:lipid-A-disaccharide synthase [Agaricicola taiwanensis]GGE44413.1 lipid-A-disaccharide synthase [Agaricicola taiwanensis]